MSYRAARESPLQPALSSLLHHPHAPAAMPVTTRRSAAAAGTTPAARAASPSPKARAVKSTSHADARVSPRPKRSDTTYESKSKATSRRPRSSRKMLHFFLGAALAALIALAAAVRAAGGAYVQSVMASFYEGSPLPVGNKAFAIHGGLFVVDLHCDATFVPRRGPPTPPRPQRPPDAPLPPLSHPLPPPRTRATPAPPPTAPSRLSPPRAAISCTARIPPSAPRGTASARTWTCPA